jgi:hypothetical protein
VPPAEATEQGEEVVCGDDPDIGRLKRQRAASRRLAPDIGTAMETAYSYGEPGYRWHSDDYWLEFIGFGRAVAGDLVAGQVARQEDTHFHNTMQDGNGDPDDARKGRVLETWLQDGQGAVYEHSTTTYGDYHEEAWPDEVFFVYAQEVVVEGLTGIAQAGAKGLIAMVEYRATASAYEESIERGEALREGLSTFAEELRQEWSILDLVRSFWVKLQEGTFSE